VGTIYARAYSLKSRPRSAASTTRGAAHRATWRASGLKIMTFPDARPARAMATVEGGAERVDPHRPRGRDRRSVGGEPHRRRARRARARCRGGGTGRFGGGRRRKSNIATRASGKGQSRLPLAASERVHRPPARASCIRKGFPLALVWESHSSFVMLSLINISDLPGVFQMSGLRPRHEGLGCGNACRYGFDSAVRHPHPRSRGVRDRRSPDRTRSDYGLRNTSEPRTVRLGANDFGRISQGA
jgi:hypothetical protein